MYSTAMFNGTVGLSRLASIYMSLGLWITYLVVCLGSMVLVDRAGRRTILILSHIGIIISFISLVLFLALNRQYGLQWAKYAAAATLFAYIASYAIGLASVPWILPGELFTQDARAAGMTLVCVVTWASVLVTSFTFSVVLPLAQEYTFIVFIVFTVLTGGFMVWKLPETRGRSIEEIQAMLRNRQRFLPTSSN